MLARHVKYKLLFIVVPIVLVFSCTILITTIPSGGSSVQGPSSVFSSTASKPILEDASTSPLPASQRQVVVDIYVINLGDVDQVAGSYSVDMYLSFAWNGTWSATTSNNTINDTSTALPINFDLTNGQINSEILVAALADINGSGYNYLSYEIQATLAHPFNLQRYPLDKQTLSIDIEDSHYNNNTLVYISDNKSMFDPGLQVAGWVIQKNSEKLSITNQIYNTNFGYPGASQDAKTAYSHVELSIVIARPVSTALLWLALPIFVLVTLTMLTFQIPLDVEVSFDKRVDIGLVTIFAAVGFLFALDIGLPAGDFTLADKVMVLVFAAVMYSNILTVMLNRYKFGPENLVFSKKVDKISFIATPIIVIGAVLLLIILG